MDKATETPKPPRRPTTTALAMAVGGGVFGFLAAKGVVAALQAQVASA